LDIDSTLHPYWELLDRIARERFGVALPYEEQVGWGITSLPGDQLVACIEETHSDENIEAAAPYEGAVAAIRRWHAAGHWIHVTSHRRASCSAATERWLAAVGIPYDDLHCSFDKVTRCIELEIDVLIDDSPVNLAAARDAGIVPATLVHPWNREFVLEAEVIAADSWPELAQLLDRALADER
jgi:beta-phosphoglucomutase-like phosphatase (HAD superfamily)